MHWFDWFMIVLFTFGALVTIGQVGKPRPAVTHAVAVWTVIINAGLIIGILLTRT